jgi:hypothetical protein
MPCARAAERLYVISGDMVQGSVIDSEYRGISTIEIMNYLAPDVVTWATTSSTTPAAPALPGAGGQFSPS